MSERIERQGQVIGIVDGRARIRLEQSGGCAGCGSRGTCGADGSAREQLIDLPLAAGTGVGDTVSVSSPASSFVLATLLGYLLPALGLLLGAIVAEIAVGGDEAAVGGAVSGFVIALLCARVLSRHSLGSALNPVVSPATCGHSFKPGDLV